MIKESKLKILWDYIWMTAVVLIVMFSSIIIPWKCSAEDIYEYIPPEEEVSDFIEIPDRKAYFQSPTIAKEIDGLMERARIMRQMFPQYEYMVQAWADMETGIWNLNMTIGHRTVNDQGHVTYTFVMVVPGSPTTYDYRKETGHEAIMGLYLDQYEWFHGREGDI